MQFAQLAQKAQELDASDIHLSPGQPPIFRTDGELTPLSIAPLLSDDIKQIMFGIMTKEQQQVFEESMEIDFSVAVHNVARFRINTFLTSGGVTAACRTIPTEIKSFADLNAPEIFEKFTKFPRGLVLVTGPTGSGKSTTLAAMINHINERRSEHIITIEDPIEFVHKTKKSLVNQRELGSNTKSFAKALKSALRQDPDVILVGELRDLETISLALTAAETGHLVFGTLHTNSAAKTIDRIIDVFPTGDKPMIRTMLASSVQAIVSQTLVKKKGGGRLAAFDILIANGPIRNLIRENKIPQIQSLMQISSHLGMMSMEDCIKSYVQQDLVELEAVKHLLPEEKKEEEIGPDGKPIPKKRPGEVKTITKNQDDEF